MFKRKPLMFIALIFAIVALFAVTQVMAQPVYPTQPDECMVIYGTKDTDWFTIGISYGPNGEWPIKKTCILGDGTTKEVAEYLYEVRDGTWNAASYYQTIPGMRPGDEQYEVNLDCSFSSIVYNPPGDGTGSKKVPCFGDNLGESAVLAYTSAPSGQTDPKKFGHSATNSYGVGWSSIAVASGNEAFFCKQYDENGNFIGYGLPGPEVGGDSLIKETIEYRSIGPAQITLAINYRDCSFKAYDPDGNLIPQFPIEELQLGRENGTPKKVKEIWSHGKCEQNTFYLGENSCGLIMIGNYYCQYCW